MLYVDKKCDICTRFHVYLLKFFINFINIKHKKNIMKTKISAVLMAALIVLSGCGASNTTKGGLIGGGSGAAVGALIGKFLVGKSTTSTLVGAGIGAAVGTTAGLLIGKKMDKAKAAAEAVANAKVESTTDANGNAAVKVSFDNGILFQVGKSNLQSAAQSSLKDFANNVLNVYTDCDVAILGFASSDGSDATNQTLSENRASAVKNYLTSCGVNAAQIKETKGLGETPEFLIKNEDGTENVAASRRVEVYLYPSKAMIDAANAGTLK